MFLMIALLLISSVTYYINIKRIAVNMLPIFTIKTENLNDGGTIIYYGIGYQIIFWKKLSDEPYYYYTGVEYHYLFDMIDAKQGPSIDLEYVRLDN